MLCFKFLKSSGFTEKLKPLGILVPIRKPERGKTSHKHYILGLKFKKLDVLTLKKQSFSLIEVGALNSRQTVCIVQYYWLHFLPLIGILTSFLKVKML